MKCVFLLFFIILVQNSLSFKQTDINFVDTSLNKAPNNMRMRRSPRGGHGGFGGGFGGGRGIVGFGGPGGRGFGGLGGRGFRGPRGFGGGRLFFGGGAGIFPFVFYRRRPFYYGPFGSFYY